MKKISNRSLSIISVILSSIAIMLFIASLFAAKPYHLYINIFGWMTLAFAFNISWNVSQRRVKALEELVQNLLEYSFPYSSKCMKEDENIEG